jgi:hypothetical protein
MKQYFILVFLIITAKCLCQLKPTFEFTLYAEDGQGRKDSLVIGYDSRASTDKVDTLFGEKDISNIRVNDTFEVRGFKIGSQSSTNYYPRTSKKIILNYKNDTYPDCAPRGQSAKCSLLIKIQNPPLKFSWNKNLFSNQNNQCIARSFFIFNRWLYIEYPPEMLASSVYSAWVNSLTDSFTVKDYGAKRGFWEEFYYPNGMKDTMRVMYIFRFENGQIRGTPTSETATSLSKIYPNPCQDKLYVQMPAISSHSLNVNIYSLNGMLLGVNKKSADSILSIDTHQLEGGTHILEILTDDGKRYIGKFFKSD